VRLHSKAEDSHTCAAIAICSYRGICFVIVEFTAWMEKA